MGNYPHICHGYSTTRKILIYKVLLTDYTQITHRKKSMKNPWEQYRRQPRLTHRFRKMWKHFCSVGKAWMILHGLTIEKHFFFILRPLNVVFQFHISIDLLNQCIYLFHQLVRLIYIHMYAHNKLKKQMTH